MGFLGFAALIGLSLSILGASTAASADQCLQKESPINPDHPVRGEFDKLAVSFIARLEREPAFAARLAALKHDVLSRPEFGDLIAALWSKVKDFADRGAAGKALALEHRLADLFADIGARLISCRFYHAGSDQSRHRQCSERPHRRA